MVRGLIDPADDFARDNVVPLGVLQGAMLTRDVPVDHDADVRRRGARRVLD